MIYLTKDKKRKNIFNRKKNIFLVIRKKKIFFRKILFIKKIILN